MPIWRARMAGKEAGDKESDVAHGALRAASREGQLPRATGVAGLEPIGSGVRFRSVAYRGSW